MISVSCLTIAAALATAKGGENLVLRGDCGPIAISRVYPRPVTIDAGGARVRGLSITGGNIVWRGGEILSSGGPVTGPGGYGLRLVKARGVQVVGTKFGLARKAIVIDGASDITITRSLFEGVGEDGIIASAANRLRITENRFRGTIGKPSQCALGGGRSVRGLPNRECKARSGVWTDGFHADAVQLRNGVTDALIAGNVIEGPTQGIGQFDTTGDAPLRRVRVERNSIAVTAHHSITFGECIDCRIVDYEVRRAPGSTRRTVIRSKPGTLVCGNRVEDVKTGTDRCPAGA